MFGDEFGIDIANCHCFKGSCASKGSCADRGWFNTLVVFSAFTLKISENVPPVQCKQKFGGCKRDATVTRSCRFPMPSLDAVSHSHHFGIRNAVHGPGAPKRDQICCVVCWDCGAASVIFVTLVPATHQMSFVRPKSRRASDMTGVQPNVFCFQHSGMMFLRTWIRSCVCVGRVSCTFALSCAGFRSVRACVCVCACVCARVCFDA